MSTCWTNEHLIALMVFIIVSGFFYLFGWYMPKKILTRGPGELDYLNIKKKIKNTNEKLKREFKRWVLTR